MKGNSSKDIGNSGKPSSGAAQPAAQPAAAANQKPITFRELDVRISRHYSIVLIHSGFRVKNKVTFLITNITKNSFSINLI